MKQVNKDSQLRGTRSAGARRVGEGFDALPRPSWTSHPPPQTTRVATLDPGGFAKADHTAPGPGPQSWSFQGGMGVQRDVGGKSKSPLIPLGPAQRASPEDGHLQSLLVNTCALLKIIIQLNRRTGNPVRCLPVSAPRPGKPGRSNRPPRGRSLPKSLPSPVPATSQSYPQCRLPGNGRYICARGRLLPAHA